MFNGTSVNIIIMCKVDLHVKRTLDAGTILHKKRKGKEYFDEKKNQRMRLVYICK